MITIEKMMSLEKVLLEAYARIKFDIGFNDLLKLRKYIIEVGDINDFVFKSQELYIKENENDTEGLKKYHKKVMSSEIEYDIEPIEEFIKKLTESSTDEGFKQIVRNYFQ